MSTAPPLFTLVNVADRRTYWVGGQCQAVIVGSADTGGRYALSHSTIAVGGGAAEHAHSREAEAFYVLSGRLAFSVAGETRMLVPGTFLHLEPGHPYSFVAGARSCRGPDPLCTGRPGTPDRRGRYCRPRKPAGFPASPAICSIEDAATLKAAARAYGVDYVDVAASKSKVAGRARVHRLAARRPATIQSCTG